MEDTPPPRAGRLLWMVAVVLMIPVIPLAMLDESWAHGLWQWGQKDASPGPVAFAATGLLASDIFLPVPSAPLVVLLAWRLGVLGATAVGVAGLTLGGLTGYWLSRAGGRRIALRYAQREELRHWEALFDSQGAWLILLTRPLPIVAECVVLAAGLSGMRVWRFSAALFAGNLIVVTGYALLGSLAAQYEMSLIAASLAALGSLAAVNLVRRER